MLPSHFDVELGNNLAVIHPAFCTSNGLGQQDIANSSTSCHNIINQAPVFRLLLHPRCFISGFLLKQCVSNSEFMLC